tara:strand:- start:2493 stop:3068 length:576 start_codon:yes stop_codon:yes gene_type:complete
MEPFSSNERKSTDITDCCVSTSRLPNSRVPIELGNLEIKISRDGSWYYQGSVIARKSLVKLFASVLTRDSDGFYYLVTPAERGRIEIEDAPFVAVSLFCEGSGKSQKLTFETNLGEKVTADSDHPIRVAYHASNGEPSPYILVRNKLEALIARSVYYDLVEHGEESASDCRVYGVWSCGLFFPLGNVDRDE